MNFSIMQNQKTKSLYIIKSDNIITKNDIK